MATEITEAGYQSIRNFLQGISSDPWTFIEIRDGSQTPVFRLGLADPRVSWVHDPGAQVLVMRVELSGSDEDITLPQSFGGAAFFQSASGGVAMAEDTFSTVTFETVDDQLVIRPRLQVPMLT